VRYGGAYPCEGGCERHVADRAGHKTCRANVLKRNYASTPSRARVPRRDPEARGRDLRRRKGRSRRLAYTSLRSRSISFFRLPRGSGRDDQPDAVGPGAVAAALWMRVALPGRLDADAARPGAAAAADAAAVPRLPQALCRQPRQGDAPHAREPAPTTASASSGRAPRRRAASGRRTTTSASTRPSAPAASARTCDRRSSSGCARTKPDRRRRTASV
jgi:hypothetical protein